MLRAVGPSTGLEWNRAGMKSEGCWLCPGELVREVWQDFLIWGVLESSTHANICANGGGANSGGYVGNGCLQLRNSFHLRI